MKNNSDIASEIRNMTEYVVEIPYGVFGRPNENLIRKAVSSWKKRGFVLQERIELNKKTKLHFVKVAGSTGFSFSKLAGYGLILLIGYFTVRAMLGGSGGSETTRATPMPRQHAPTAIVAKATSTLIPTFTPTTVPPTNTPTSTLTPSLMPTPTNTPVPATLIGQEGINVRSCASTACSVVGVVFSQDEVRVLSRTTDWYAVVLPDGNQGYIWNQLLSLPKGVDVAEITLTPTPTPRPTQRPRSTQRPANSSQSSTSSSTTSQQDREDAMQINDTLAILAGGRNVESVQVVNGRPNGGERAAFIGYLTTETTDVGSVDEILDILDAVYIAMTTYDIDLDAIGLIIGDPFGNAIGTVVTSADSLVAFKEGRLSRSTFLGRLAVEDF